jgi:hypothetical protein
MVKSKLEEIFAYRVLKVNEILIQNNDKTESIFFLVSTWFTEDNIGLFHALESEYPVIPLFIYDDAILDSLPKMIRELDLFMNHWISMIS